jgi:transcriptional antiterminator Rof (Rho-off)
MRQDDRYRPVSCASHSEYELHIIRKQHLLLEWEDSGGNQRCRVLPVDLQTRQGEEYLIFVNAHGDRQRVRLDRIINKTCCP